MTDLLILLVKLARDGGYTDKQLAEYLHDAADRVNRGGFWPSDIDSNSLRYQNCVTRIRGGHDQH